VVEGVFVKAGVGDEVQVKVGLEVEETVGVTVGVLE
jgi:hypothetical protein